MDGELVFAASAIERRAVADLLDGLDERQLATPSLCAGWDVRMVAAHLVGAVALGGRDFVKALVRARGNPHRTNDVLARDVARRPVAELAELLRVHADSRFAPPFTGPRAPLTDALVHAGTCGYRSGCRTTRPRTPFTWRWTSSPAVVRSGSSRADG